MYKESLQKGEMRHKEFLQFDRAKVELISYLSIVNYVFINETRNTTKKKNNKIHR